MSHFPSAMSTILGIHRDLEKLDANQMWACGRLEVVVSLLVILPQVFSQMTFTDNWQKRASFGHNGEWAPVESPCEPVTSLDRLRELQRLQRQILLLMDEATMCASQAVSSPPLYPKNPKYSFPTYVKTRKN
ncbi:unnamed protein product, partial [Mesorhabditis belari]|uniref:Uncharacterized protein n=1 Tax=Mesorhabditis belari TaxID=2138241 RepID=A0AAF3JAJ6_9BILA